MRFVLLLLGCLLSTAAFAHQAEYSEPLGDGKISSAPQAGYIWSCQQNFNANAPGAQVVGSWIRNGKWFPDEKIHVQGDVAWPNSSISITAENGQRVIRANNLPTHATGVFPVQQTDPAFRIDRNPNSIAAQNILLTLPLEPVVAEQPSCLGMGMIGFTLTGTALFNGLDAGGRDAAAHEVLDKCDGHPPRDGQYHYHRYSPCMADVSGNAGHHSDLVGYALDGFGIYGLHGETGDELTNADLDACHGHSHKILWNGRMQEIYHYHMTREYPYSLGCFKGTPLQLQLQRNNPHDGSAPHDGGPQGSSSGEGAFVPGSVPTGAMSPDRGRRIMETAARLLNVNPEQLRQAVGPPPPDFTRASQQLGIPAEQIKAAFEQARGQQ